MPRAAKHLGREMDFSEVEEILRGVTPGPWVYEYTGIGHTVRQPGAYNAIFTVNHAGNFEQDARFIAWCREGVPALLAQNAALRAERDALLTTWAESRERHLAAEAKVEKLRGALEGWLELASHCDIAEGVCCCGESMEGHSNPMDCGHTPLDHGAYIAMQLGEETRAALTTEAAQAPTDTRPANCRFRLKDEGKPYGRSSCSACGKSVFTGLGNSCTKGTTDAAQAREAALRDAAEVVDAALMRWGFPSTDGCKRDEMRSAILALLSETRT